MLALAKRLKDANAEARSHWLTIRVGGQRQKDQVCSLNEECLGYKTKT